MNATFRRGFLILLVALISVGFLWMIRAFLVTILLAALFSGVAYGVYRRLVKAFRGRETPAAVVTLMLLLALVIVPLMAVLGAVANEAQKLNQTLLPRVQQLINEPGELERLLGRVPGYASYIAPHRAEIITKAGELVGAAGSQFIDLMSAMTRATVLFIFHFVVLLYTMFFFLTDGPKMVKQLLAHLPLAESDKDRLLERFVSVTRATLKGTVLIGAAQGILGGLAFWAVGIEGALFWGTVMTVLSVIPGVGGALVWVPAAIVLAATGSWLKAIGLAAFCALVVGSVDNLLRPILVGRDTQMHELMIFFSTLGGLLTFGAMGFILGPILAVLFMTIWELFGMAFRTELRS
jgi:predicted PurR-regulated permease PerM